MGNPSRRSARRAQSAVEYMILLSVAAVIALVGFKTFLPRSRVQAGNYFNTAARGIMGVTAAKSGAYFKARTNQLNYP